MQRYPEDPKAGVCARDHASALVVGGIVGEKDEGRFEGREWGGGGGEDLRVECGEKGRGKEVI